MYARRFRRDGVAAVELAVCLPLLLILVFGIWEVGRMVQAHQLLLQGAREGGRQAAAGRMDATAVRQFVVDYLNTNGLTGVTLSDVTLTNVTDANRSNPATANQLDQFRVTVTVPYASIRWSNVAQITPTTQLGASVDWYSMRDLPIEVTMTIPVN